MKRERMKKKVQFIHNYYLISMVTTTTTQSNGMLNVMLSDMLCCAVWKVCRCFAANSFLLLNESGFQRQHPTHEDKKKIKEKTTIDYDGMRVSEQMSKHAGFKLLKNCILSIFEYGIVASFLFFFYLLDAMLVT